jgi:hypothetical protein
MLLISIETIDERTLDDIESWEFALDKIIEARGTVVHGLTLKHGHRALVVKVNITVKIVFIK